MGLQGPRIARCVPSVRVPTPPTSKQAYMPQQRFVQIAFVCFVLFLMGVQALIAR